MSPSEWGKCYKSFGSVGNSLRRDICNKQYLVYIYCWQQSCQRKFPSYNTTSTPICSVTYWGHLGWHSWKNFCQYWHLPEFLLQNIKCTIFEAEEIAFSRRPRDLKNYNNFMTFKKVCTVLMGSVYSGGCLFEPFSCCSQTLSINWFKQIFFNVFPFIATKSKSRH